MNEYNILGASDSIFLLYGIVISNAVQQRANLLESNSFSVPSALIRNHFSFTHYMVQCFPIK